MPTPVGHGLMGLALGVGFLIPRGLGFKAGLEAVRQKWKLLVAVGLLACLPDLDYIPGLFVGDWNKYHHYHVHSLGWCVLMTVSLCLIIRIVRTELKLRWAVFILICLSSHLVLDLMCVDQREPIGILMLWPLSEARFHGPWEIFPPLYKSSVAEVFQWKNVYAVLVEVAVLLPLLFGVWLYKCLARGRASEVPMVVEERV